MVLLTVVVEDEDVVVEMVFLVIEKAVAEEECIPAAMLRMVRKQ